MTNCHCHSLKVKAKDGKLRNTDVLNTKGILRLIESVPSPKTEPFKIWLANLGTELEVLLTDIGSLSQKT